MEIRWSDWNRLVVFAIFVFLLILVITVFSISEAEARDSLQASYALSSHDICHVLTRQNAAAYIAEKLAEMSGEAISPLLSLSVIGVFHNRCTGEQYRELLPWYFQLKFLFLTSGLLLLLTFKDTLLSPLGALKKPVDALGEFVHFTSGIVALPIGLIYFADGVANPIAESIFAISSWIMPSAYAASNALVGPSDLFLILGQLLGISIGLVLFGTIWMLGNVIEVLILLSPIPFVDTVLSGIRAGLTAILIFFAYLNPILGGILALAIIIVSAQMFGWSFRLFTFGIVYCADIFCLKWRNLKIDNKGVIAFSGAGLPKTKTCSLGRIYPGRHNIVFSYYPFLVLPKKRVNIFTNSSKNQVSIMREMIAPTISSVDVLSKKNITLFRLTPRYRKNEVSVGTYLKLPFSPEANVNRKSGLSTWLKHILA